MPRWRLTHSLIFSFLALATWQGFLSATNSTTTTWNYLFNAAVGAFYILVSILAFRRCRKTQLGSSRKILIYIGLAALSWGIAFLIWTYYNLVLQVNTPYPSLADLAFLISYPLLGFALWELHINYDTSITSKDVQESIAIVVASAVVIFFYLNRPDLSPDLGLTKNLLNVAYSLADVMLVAIAFIELRSGQAKKYKGLYFLVAFLLLQAAGDFVFAYRNNEGIYWNGDFADLLFGASAFTLALAVGQNNLLRGKVKS
jgi:diguanylate cyclase